MPDLSVRFCIVSSVMRIVTKIIESSASAILGRRDYRLTRGLGSIISDAPADLLGSAVGVGADDGDCGGVLFLDSQHPYLRESWIPCVDRN